MTWAYSPSYGKPLSVPQGVVGLMTRMGMEVVLWLIRKATKSCLRFEEVATKEKNAGKTGGSFRDPMTWLTHSRMLTSYIQRAGLHLQLWKREPTCTQKAIPGHQDSGERTAGSERRAQRLVLY